MLQAMRTMHTIERLHRQIVGDVVGVAVNDVEGLGIWDDYISPASDIQHFPAQVSISEFLTTKQSGF